MQLDLAVSVECLRVERGYTDTNTIWDRNVIGYELIFHETLYSSSDNLSHALVSLIEQKNYKFTSKRRKTLLDRIITTLGFYNGI